MINRVLIRVKVLQIVYAYFQKKNKDYVLAENELIFSIQKSYDLYFHLLSLILMLTDYEQKRLDKRKHKYLATENEKNPDTRFVDNLFSAQLDKNKQLRSFLNEKGFLWSDDTVLLKNLSEKIQSSEFYADYMKSQKSYDSDKEFWKKVFKNIILTDEELLDLLEDKSIYWNDDLGIIGTFVLKTIKRFEEVTPDDSELMPMFKDETDREFAIELLRHSIVNGDIYREMIDAQIKNWDLDRIANIDLYIMQIALAELLNFSSIPVNVTLNEYIDIAKCYSTPKSGTFINGTLDAVVGELKKENKLFKG